MTIVGIGMDAVELERIEYAMKRRVTFIEKILTKNELAEFHKRSAKRQIEFLAGRYAAKEAYSKALGTGIGKNVGFLDVEILSDSKGKPIVTKGPFDGQVFLSLSHTKRDAFAYIIFEQLKEV